MKQHYLRFFVFISTSIFLMVGFAESRAEIQGSVADSTRSSKTKITDTRSNKPAYLKNGVKVNFIPFKPSVDKIFGNTSAFPGSVKNQAVADDKVLNNVKVFPNPVSDQINLTYRISKDSNITIKIMDVLGNEIAVLFSEHLKAGEQINSFSISSKLNSGFYFIRLIAGNETVIKRISVL